MGRDHLSTYLTDHYAGSVSAAELVGRLLEAGLNADLTAALQLTLESIHRHQGVIQDLLHQRGDEESHGKNLGARLAERISRPALPVGPDDDFGLLRALEILILGMQGRVALWQTMEVVAPSHPELQPLNATALRMEAEEAVKMMDRFRLEAARAALRGWVEVGNG